ncbi:hypothetical protein [uncultured Arthrobacter sp.]|uniref:hypothetical protein n=1 Tax=uncultured Arthrobacter sp. TaxID=114050 RepID=UPI003217E465
MEEKTPDLDYPEHWTESARDAFESVMAQRPGLEGAEFASLVQVAELLTSADLLEAEARKTGLLVPGSTGQLTTNPGVVEGRLARTAAATILARLVPPSKGGAMTNSERGRMAARARYGSK